MRRATARTTMETVAPRGALNGALPVLGCRRGHLGHSALLIFAKPRIDCSGLRSSAPGRLTSTTGGATLSPAMTFPPRDSPVWAQLEEDAAAERGTPLFNSRLVRGPKNELKRRRLFKASVIYHQQPLVLPLLGYFFGSCVALIGLSMALGHRHLGDLLEPLAGAVIFTAIVGFTIELPQRRRDSPCAAAVRDHIEHRPGSEAGSAR